MFIDRSVLVRDCGISLWFWYWLMLKFLDLSPQSITLVLNTNELGCERRIGRRLRRRSTLELVDPLA
jgi:hypothetical protein